MTIIYDGKQKRCAANKKGTCCKQKTIAANLEKKVFSINCTNRLMLNQTIAANSRFCGKRIFFVCSHRFLFASHLFCLQRSFFVCSMSLVGHRSFRAVNPLSQNANPIFFQFKKVLVSRMLRKLRPTKRRPNT